MRVVGRPDYHENPSTRRNSAGTLHQGIDKESSVRTDQQAEAGASKVPWSMAISRGAYLGIDAMRHGVHVILHEL